jgi:glycosyltransferase involved in cell wall biosynthesis
VQTHSTARLFVEEDGGVYDALNRGFARATGERFAFLHCDEQYLSGALSAVESVFAREPEVDLVVGDYLIVDKAGRLLSFHRATPLRASMVVIDHLYDYTCALFFRRRLWEKSGGFRSDYAIVADADWIARVLATKPRIAYLGEFTSTFALTGENLSQRPAAREEERRLRASAPAWARAAAPFLRRYRHFEKLLRGGYRRAPIEYAIYTDELEHRTAVRVERPSSRHPWVRRTHTE